LVASKGEAITVDELVSEITPKARSEWTCAISRLCDETQLFVTTHIPAEPLIVEFVFSLDHLAPSPLQLRRTPCICFVLACADSVVVAGDQASISAVAARRFWIEWPPIA
jgi:hypothetical protein